MNGNNNNQSVQFIERLISALLSEVDVKIDIFNLFEVVQKFDFSDRELIILFQFVSENIEYFKSNLREPIELSNLMSYCGSALKVSEEKWGGSQNRNRITREVKVLLTGYGVR